MSKYEKTGEHFPCGPCHLPLECSVCGEIITEESVLLETCSDGDCEICLYCSNRKCPNCKSHTCCGGCV